MLFLRAGASAQLPPVTGLDRLLDSALNRSPDLKQIEIHISLLTKEIDRLNSSPDNSKFGMGLAYYPNKLIRGPTNDPLRRFHERTRFYYAKTLWDGQSRIPKSIWSVREKLAKLRADYFRALQKVTGSLVGAYLNYSLTRHLLEINGRLIRLLNREEKILRVRERQGEALPSDWLQIIWQKEKQETDQAGYRKLLAVSRERLRALEPLPDNAEPEPLPWNRYLLASLPELSKLKQQLLPHSTYLAQFPERTRLKRRQAAESYRSGLDAYKLNFLLRTDLLYNDSLHDNAVDNTAQLNFVLPLGYGDNNRLLRSQLADERLMLQYRKKRESDRLNERLTEQFYEVAVQRERLFTVQAALNTVREEVRIKRTQIDESPDLAGSDPAIALLQLEIKRLSFLIKREKTNQALAAAFLDLDRTSENRLAQVHYSPPAIPRMTRLELAQIPEINSEASPVMIQGRWSDWANLSRKRFNELVKLSKRPGLNIYIGITSLGECLGINPDLAAELNLWLKNLPLKTAGVQLWLETPEEAGRSRESWWKAWQRLLDKVKTTGPLFLRLPIQVLYRPAENGSPPAEKLLENASGLVFGEKSRSLHQWITRVGRAVLIGAVLDKAVWIALPPYTEDQPEKINYLRQTFGKSLSGVIYSSRQ
ncbi:MAG: hypothetical protein ACE5GM_05510 [bacterium]